MISGKTSIIIPAHNRPELLVEAVVSCLIQTRSNLEVLVVDDGSDQDLGPALEQARQFTSSDEMLRVIRQPKMGAPAARNRGLQESQGEFIQFFDSDDLLHPEKLQKQAALLENDTALDLVFCLDEWFAESIGDMGLLWNAPDGRPELDRFPWNDVVWQTGSPLWRRSALERIGPWDTRLACWQDWEFHIRALSKGIRYAHLPEVLQFIRDHKAPRISETLGEVVRERSKVEAFRQGGQHLKAHGLLNRDRGDGMAIFLLHSAHELVRLNEVDLARTTLWIAARYAGSPAVKTAAVVMLAASFIAQFRHKSQVSALNRAQLFVEGYAKPPVRESKWKSIRTVRTQDPKALREAVRKVRSQMNDSVYASARNNSKL